MPPIEGDLETATEDAEGCADLAHFSCGDGTLPGAEEDVEGLIEDLHAGIWTDAVVRLTREVPGGSLVGLVALEPRKGPLVDHPAVPAKENDDAGFIIVLALSEAYRGRYTDKDGVPLSDRLLRDALEYLADGADTPPPAQALIAPVNNPSRELCGRFGFVDSQATIGALLYIRPRGLPIDPPAQQKAKR